MISGILAGSGATLLRTRMATPPNAPSALRPKRFDIEVPVEFRPQDSDRWWQARSEDISANGILFRSRKRVPPLMPVDVKLQLPAALTGERTVQLLCSGYVVRSVEPQPPSDEARIAATFLNYKLANAAPGPIVDLQQPKPLETRGDLAKLVHRLKNLLFIIQGMAELVALDPSNHSKFRSMALQTNQAAKEAATVVQSLETLIHTKPPETAASELDEHPGSNTNSEAKPQLYCRACGSSDVRPSRRHHAVEDFVLRMVHLRPYRCRACRHRFYASTRYFYRAA